MAPNSTLLCIHRDPEQLRSLRENGYELVSATNGYDGLRLCSSQPVNAVVLDYHLGVLDGTFVANEIKRVHPMIPIVMVSDDLELPDGALSSIDALVTRSDGAHFLWATVHFVLNVKPAQNLEVKSRIQMPAHLRRPGKFPGQAHGLQAKASLAQREAPFSAKEWNDIRTGMVRF